MDKTKKDALIGKKNELSQEELAKRREVNKKIIGYGCLPIIGIFLLIVLVLKCATDNSNRERDYSTEAQMIIEQIRNPEDEQKLKDDYEKASILFEEMKVVKDSSNSFISSQMELEALLIYKDENIRNETKKMRVQKQFSSWDGSHRNLEKYIKQQMNDPKSYEHVGTKYNINDSIVTIYTTFRGKNAFNSVVVNEAIAISDLDGNLLEVKFE